MDEPFAWFILGAIAITAGGGFMPHLTVGLLVSQLLFFGLIVSASKFQWKKRIDVTHRSTDAERDALRAEVQRLNKKNVELVQENLKHKYRN